ncbi:hypothetical protein FOA43_001914 [Brettanomyces nanus]|uniref:Ataxin-10 homolog n=1 Tax=Eeniella nana TaxID=13502 RepID=A0A875S0Z7_EENNA|nr:uncharacterized protein FOA43_001914 [Brettanomyces nanus]QPG74583.1 hypothetical protein FOA43_001914 [Brettanomyces nanus]
MEVINEVSRLVCKEKSADYLIPVEDNLSLENNYSMALKSLSVWISKIGKDQTARRLLAQSSSLWELIEQFLERESNSIRNEHDGEYARDRLRVLRGVVLLTSNVLGGVTQDNKMDFSKLQDQFSSLCVCFLQKKEVKVYDGIVVLGALACFQALSNLLVSLENQGKPIEWTENDFSAINAVVCTNCTGEDSRALWISMFRYLGKLTSSEDFVKSWLEDHLPDYKNLMVKYRKQVANNPDSIVPALNLSFHIITSAYIEKLVTILTLQDEQILETFLQAHKNEDEDSCLELNFDTEPTVLMILLRDTQIIVGSKDTGWTRESKIIVASWLMNYTLNLKTILTERCQTISVDSILKAYKWHLAPTLDSISSLLRFSTVTEMLNSYNFLSNILMLFEIVCKKTKRGRLDDAENDIDSSKMAGIKSMILEIIGYLVSGNFKNQELVRNQHSLELVLDSCNLDFDEPFIRERGILCIKSLLDNNRGNQDFIANLEAKGTKMDEKSREIMEDCGYQVEFEEGQVRLKAKGSIKEV